MSRTEGIHLPRLPISHVRATSSHAIQHHSSTRKTTSQHTGTLSEPHYTAYIGTPRQDVPHQVYRDAAMFDDVFDRQGKLLSSRNTPKITSPLNSMEYNSLHDPHCKRLFLNNQMLRDHLTHLGLLTDDLRVVATTKEQRQKIRAHELLERKEELLQRMSERENQRIEKLQKAVSLPVKYQMSMKKQDERKKNWEKIRDVKIEKLTIAEKKARMKELERKNERKKQLQELLEQIKLSEQTKRNAAQHQQELAEITAYDKQYGKTAVWHRASDHIHNRMIYLAQTTWRKRKDNDWLSESFPQPGRKSSDDTPIDLESDLCYFHHKEEEVRQNEEEVREEEEKDEELREEEEKDEEMREEEEKEEVWEELEEKVYEDDKREPEIESTTKEVTEHKEPISSVTDIVTDHETKSPTQKEPPPIHKEVIKMNAQQSTMEMTRLFLDLLARLDHGRTGFMSFDEFFRTMGSHDLALPLDQEELFYIAGQVDAYGNGWIPLIQATSMLPLLLLELFQQRMQLQMQQYGSYIEDRWLQLSSPNIGYMYMDKTTGLVQRGRPSDYRTYLMDDWFEDVVVDLFETADTNRDGYVDESEFIDFLQSPVISSRVYTQQMEELHKLFIDQTVEGVMGLEQFVPLAHIMLQMIYSNSYPDKEWIELESRKCGVYFFNPTTGEMKLPDTVAMAAPSKEKPSKERKKRRKDSKLKDSEGETTPTSTGPPPLRRRSSKSTRSSRSDDKETNQSDDVKMDNTSGDSHVTGESSRDGLGLMDEEFETRKLVEQVAERLQTGLNIIETIPEEDEQGEVLDHHGNKDDETEVLDHHGNKDDETEVLDHHGNKDDEIGTILRAVINKREDDAT